MLPYAVTLIPTFLLWAELGLINTYWPLVLPDWVGGSIFYIFLLRQFFLTLPRELDEAAIIDGANPLQVLRHVVVPLSRPALITVGIFSSLFEWNDFLGPLIYLNDSRRFTLALGLAEFTGHLHLPVAPAHGRRYRGHRSGADPVPVRTALLHRGDRALRHQGLNVVGGSSRCISLHQGRHRAVPAIWASTLCGVVVVVPVIGRAPALRRHH